MFFNNNSMNHKVDNNTFYKILEVDKKASGSEIKKAYRRLAVIHHPDKGGDPEKFKEITKAFETLSDEENRKLYDQYGESDGNMNGPPGDIFGQMFGMRQNTSQKKGDNVIHKVNITLKEIYNGKTINVTVNRKTIDSSSIDTCLSCQGKGMTIKTMRMGPMVQQIQQPCHICNGRGQSYNINNITENIKIIIPKGVPNNHNITIYEKGHDIVNGDPGDLIVVVNEIKDDILERKGYDLFIHKDISLLEALKGFKIELNTLDNRNILIINNNIIKPYKNNKWISKLCNISLEPFAKAQISDENNIKEIIETGQLKKENITGFIIKGSETFFYKDSVDNILKSSMDGSYMFYYKSQNNVHCIEEEGMPYFNSPMIKGDLYITFNIIFPDKVTIENDILIEGGFNKSINNPTCNEIDSDIEVYELTKKNPGISYNKYKDSIQEDQPDDDIPQHSQHSQHSQQCSQQ